MFIENEIKFIQDGYGMKSTHEISWKHLGLIDKGYMVGLPERYFKL